MTNRHFSLPVAICIAIVVVLAQAILTNKMVRQASEASKIRQQRQDLYAPVIQTSCNRLDFSKTYDYQGIVASGYLTIGKGSSALAYTFYGQKNVQTQSDLRNYPTILWLNGGPGLSSQIGNLQEIGPLLLIRDFDTKIVKNNYTWANKYNLLFIDQPVGTGLSYADSSFPNVFAKNMDQVAADFYRALIQLYNGRGCFSNEYFSIPASNPLYIFGEGYAGKYAPAIAAKIIRAKEQGGFLTGLKGVGIGDGLTYPYEIFSEIPTYAYHLGLLDFQERMKLQKMMLNASRHELMGDMNSLHYDFNHALQYIAERAGNINLYDIKSDGQNQELLRPYFRDEDVLKIYGFNPEVLYDGHVKQVYTALWNDFMKSEIGLVEELLSKGIPVLVYNGQDDLIVPNPGAMRWVDRLNFPQAADFRKQLFSAWKLNNKVVGAIKLAGPLEFRIVNNATKLVPSNCPAQALDMVSSFVGRTLA